MPSDMYLSGNVRLKLEEAIEAVNEGNADLQRNVDALKEIIPRIFHTSILKPKWVQLGAVVGL